MKRRGSHLQRRGNDWRISVQVTWSADWTDRTCRPNFARPETEAEAAPQNTVQGVRFHLRWSVAWWRSLLIQLLKHGQSRALERLVISHDVRRHEKRVGMSYDILHIVHASSRAAFPDIHYAVVG